jgi:hypothetical protein
VDDGDLEIGVGIPEVVDEAEDVFEVVADVLLDDGDEIGELFEVDILAMGSSDADDMQKGGEDLEVSSLPARRDRSVK